MNVLTMLNNSECRHTQPESEKVCFAPVLCATQCLKFMNKVKAHMPKVSCLTRLVAIWLKNTLPRGVVRKTVCNALTKGRCIADCRFLCSILRDTFCSCTPNTSFGLCTAACRPAMPARQKHHMSTMAQLRLLETTTGIQHCLPSVPRCKTYLQQSCR